MLQVRDLCVDFSENLGEVHAGKCTLPHMKLLVQIVISVLPIGPFLSGVIGFIALVVVAIKAMFRPGVLRRTLKDQFNGERGELPTTGYCSSLAFGKVDIEQKPPMKAAFLFLTAASRVRTVRSVPDTNLYERE